MLRCLETVEKQTNTVQYVGSKLIPFNMWIDAVNMLFNDEILESHTACRFFRSSRHVSIQVISMHPESFPKALA